MTLPVIRTKLKTASSKNQGLQDILKSCSRGMEILSVDKHTGGIHNTKITLKVDLGEGYPKEQRYQTRVHFYNRVAIVNVIPQGVSYPTVDIEETIEILNNQYGCDFTEDDIYISGNGLLAKETSLGYYNKVVDSTCNCVLDHQGLSLDDSNYLMDSFYDPNTGQSISGVQQWYLDVLVNGTIYRKIIPGMEVGGTRFVDAIASIMSDHDLYEQMLFSMSSAGAPATFVQNLTNQCGSFGVNVIPIINGNQWGSLPFIGDMELCPYGESSLQCDGVARMVQIPNITSATFVPGFYELTVNGRTVEVHSSNVNFFGNQLWNLMNEIANAHGFLGYYSAYILGSEQSGAGNGQIENQTEDCLHIHFAYKGGASGYPSPQVIFDVVLGVDYSTIYRPFTNLIADE